jgi:hypothetical protein
MTQSDSRGYESWVELAKKASKETDPEKLMRILGALCRALKERETLAEVQAAPDSGDSVTASGRG